MAHAVARSEAGIRTRPALGRAIAIACAIGAGGGLAAFALGFVSGAGAVEEWRLAARYTARFAFLLFLPVYLAGPWHRLAPSARTRAVVLRRRALGLGFASAHTVHLVALLGALRASGESLEATAAVGGAAYAATFAMAATSNDAAVRRLGRGWRRLHRVGLQLIWFVFAFSYAGRLLAGQLFFAPFAAAALGALGLRLAALRARRRSARAG
jgi:DMSO/TMAO reductase YedYZ heme-binding membrane subunit